MSLAGDVKALEDENARLERRATELDDENEAWESRVIELEGQTLELEDKIEALKSLEDDIEMLCGRLGITRHEGELERGHIRNQLLK